MAKRLQLRRGTTTEHSTFAGAVGEVTVDTDKDTVVVHDGSTVGGTPLATAADNSLKADTTYVDTELVAKQDTLVSGTNIKTINNASLLSSGNIDLPASINKVASNVLLSGNLALASSAVTKSNANITYTGNGSTQSITTGIASVDFTVASNGSGYYHDRAAGDCIVKNDAGTVIESGSCVVNVSKVHIKARSSLADHIVYDGLRGDEFIRTNSVTPETAFTAFTFSSNGINLVTGDNGVNGNTLTYILHQTLYTHIKWGLTSQGKRYITAYNPVTREVMTMYQGSGVAGHQIPNPLGIKLDYWENKEISNTSAWVVARKDNFFMRTNTTGSEVASVVMVTSLSENYTEIGGDGSINESNEVYISYGFANSETKIITQYQGTGASGNFVETKDVNGVAKKPRRVILKCINLDTSWNVIDTERGIGSGSEPYIDLNSSLNEATYNFGYLTPNGIMFEGTGISLNDPNGQYIAIVEFDTTASNDDTYFDLPTDDTNLNVLAGKLPYTDGRDTTNGAYNVFTQSYTGSVDFSTCPDGIHYVALDSNNAPKFYDALPIFNSVTGVMYDNDGTIPLTTPISFIDDKPYQVASGTAMDRLEDYPSIPKNIMEATYVDGDLEVSGEVKGKNQCTGWVNFDGTTTPPTIRDSFNVSDVVRTATGQYDVYFEEDMDNVNYGGSGSGDLYTGGDAGICVVTATDASKFSVFTTNSAGTEYNRNLMFIQIFGGK